MLFHWPYGEKRRLTWERKGGGGAWPLGGICEVFTLADLASL